MTVVGVTGAQGAVGADGPGSPSRAGARRAPRGVVTLARLGGLVAVVAVVASEAWSAYEAADCLSSAKFACLVESLVAAALLAVLAPPALWLLYRRAGLRRPVLSTLTALGVALPLAALPSLVVALAALVGLPEPPLAGPGASWSVVAVAVPAVVVGALPWDGRAGARRAGVVVAALVVLVVGSGLAQGPADAARERRDVLRADVALVLAPGWRWAEARVAADGRLSYRVVPDGYEGDPWDGVRVDLRPAPEERPPWCPEPARYCREVDGVWVQQLDPGEPVLTAWRLVAGQPVDASDHGDGDALDPVAFLRDARVVTVEEFLDARR